MSHTYYVRVRGRTLGPYDLDAIRQMARRAQVGRSHEVSLDGLAWTIASNYPEIFERPQVAGTDPRGFGTQGTPSGTAGFPPGGTVPSGPPVGPTVMWHYTVDGQQQDAPIDHQTLVNLIASGRIGGDDNVWNETMSDWKTVADMPELAAYALPHAAVSSGTASGGATGPVFPGIVDDGASPTYQAFVGKKVPAGVVALFLGNLGIHKFMLGLTTGGLTTLLLFFLIVPIPILTVISLVEGILYLSKSDQQFFRDYAVDRKQWF